MGIDSRGPARLNRRKLIGGSLAMGACALLPDEGALAATAISVLCTLPPDPAPPGVADYAKSAFAKWQAQNGAYLNYESVAWSILHDKLVNFFEAGAFVYDIFSMSGWVPEFAKYLAPLEERIPQSLRADLPRSSLNVVSWDDHILGTPSTLSLLTLAYNASHLSDAGISGPPTTWDELKNTAKELTRDGRYGWRMNYGAPGGIGGTASYWMTFLQQAGGKVFGDDGNPVFHDAPGVDALQFMVDLMPSTDPHSMIDTSIVDTTIGMRAGDASMCMNWPFMWATLQNDPTSPTAGQFATAILPAGEAGTASLDGSDAWVIARDSKITELSMDWIAFCLSSDVQLQQALITGWLPIRTSVYERPELQQAMPHAAVVLEQSKHPYDSFVTPDYAAVTTAIGNEVVYALHGVKSASAAISDASDAVASIVSKRQKS